MTFKAHCVPQPTKNSAKIVLDSMLSV